MFFRFVVYLAGLALVCSASVIPGGGPGFGHVRKKTLDLQIRQPAPVRLANTSIAFQAFHTNPQYQPIVGSLIVTLSTELVSNEKTLVEKQSPKEAAWTLDLSVTGLSIAQPEKRTSGNVSYTRWNGTLNVAYQVVDRTGQVYDAANVGATYNKEFSDEEVGTASRLHIPVFGHGKHPEQVPSSIEDVKQILINDVVQKIATKLGNTTQPIEVEVAQGETHLDRAGDFMAQKLWTRAVDELESMPALPKQEQDAYRQYDLGLAYEAMSYAATTAQDQRQDISKAAEYYDKALEMNQREKYFVQSVARTRDAMARIKDLETMAKTDGKMAHPPLTDDTPDAKKVSKDSSSGGSKALSLQDVADMIHANVPESQIIDVIQDSQVSFNPRAKEDVMFIAREKIPVKIQNALRAKVGAPPINSGK